MPSEVWEITLSIQPISRPRNKPPLICRQPVPSAPRPWLVNDPAREIFIDACMTLPGDWQPSKKLEIYLLTLPARDRYDNLSPCPTVLFGREHLLQFILAALAFFQLLPVIENMANADKPPPQTRWPTRSSAARTCCRYPSLFAAIARVPMKVPTSKVRSAIAHMPDYPSVALRGDVLVRILRV